MYFWKVNALAEDFRNDKVTQKEQLKYFLLYSLLISFVIDVPALGDSSWNSPIFEWVELGVNLIITFWGIIWCFRANQQGDDKDFLARTLCLGLPIAVRLLLWCIILLIIEIILFKGGQSIWRDIFRLAETALFMILYYALTRKYILYIAINENKNLHE